MRRFCLPLLLFATLGLSYCSSPPADTTPADTTPVEAPAPAETLVGSASGTAISGEPGPDPDHRRVPPGNVRQQDTVYAATLPVLDERDGTIRIRVAINPRAHTLEKVSVLFAPHQPRVRYQQLGQGVGKYDAKTGRYYFLTGYQKISPLADGRLYNSPFLGISGWVHPEAGAEVAHKGAFSEE